MEPRYLRDGYLFALGVGVGSLLAMAVTYLVLARQGRDPAAHLIQALHQILGRDRGIRFDLLLQ